MLDLTLNEVHDPLGALSRTDLRFLETMASNGGDALSAYYEVFGSEAGGIGAALSLKAQLSQEYRYILSLMAMSRDELMLQMSTLMRQVGEDVSTRDYTSLASVYERLLRLVVEQGEGGQRPPGSLQEAYELLAPRAKIAEERIKTIQADDYEEL